MAQIRNGRPASDVPAAPVAVERDADESARLGGDEAPQDFPNPPDSLVLVNLLAWAAENHYADRILGEMELGAAVQAAEADPEAAYENLESERILDEETPAGLAAVLVSRMSDLLDDRSLPETFQV